LGAFLSGGVDSSLVVAIVRRELRKEINTYSIGFEGSAESEHEDARAIAQHLGANHHDSMVKPDGIELINHIASILDQPNGDSSCLPTYLLSEFARKEVTVILSGDGGDELFGGYGRYRDTMNEWANPELIRKNHGIDPKTATPADLYMSLRWHIWLPGQVETMMDGLPPATRVRVASWRAILNDPSTSLMHRMRTIDANIYMPGAVLAKVDRMGMQHALEIRSPLLDPQFAEIAMGLGEDDCWAPPDVTKKLLKEIASEYLPREWMFRAKKGFGLPSNAWAMEDVISLCGQTLNSPNTRLRDHMSSSALKAAIETQSRKGHFSIYQMWPLLMLELWLREQPSKIERTAREYKRAA
jgi:asparagine synthase (glutamine-hydrolysing)